ncbi:MAG: MFS transporter [Planctomycetes bacterium]|nr:MFS transporter [Planctomycetota bacterium]
MFVVDLRTIFLLAFITGMLAALMVFFVREEAADVGAKDKHDISLSAFPASYWRYLGVTALFGLGNFSNAFLILRTSDLHVDLTTTIFIYAMFNLVAALASYPAGYLSDVFGRKSLLLCCFLVFIGVFAGFGFTTDPIAVAVLFVMYGIFQGVFRSVGKAMTSDFLPDEMRASGIGWYTATVGVTGLVASLTAGQLWVEVSPSVAFLTGASFGVAGSIALLFLESSPRAAETELPEAANVQRTANS